ncbi:hypothetical protein KR222_006681, partial [Zaprionus bogoriensis]
AESEEEDYTVEDEEDEEMTPPRQELDDEEEGSLPYCTVEDEEDEEVTPPRQEYRSRDPRRNHPGYGQRTRPEPPPSFPQSVHISRETVVQKLNGGVMVMVVEKTTFFVQVPRMRPSPPYVEEP